MSTTTSLLKKTGIYAAGTFGSKILTFLLIPLYSYYLNKEEFGYYDLIITAVNLLVPFVTLQISDSTFRWLIGSEEDGKRINAITNAFIVTSLSIVVCVVLSLVTFFIHPLEGHFLITLLIVSAIVYPFIQQIARGLGKAKMFALNGVIFTFTYLIGTLIFLIYLNLEIEALFYSSIIAYLLASFILIVRLKLWKYVVMNRFNYKISKEMLIYSLPLVPNTISWWLINSANKYIILFFMGVSANGLFAMSNRFPVILVMVNQVFTLAWQETAIVGLKKDQKPEQYTKVLNTLIIIQFSLVTLLSLSSQLLVEKFLSSNFSDAWTYMPTLYLGAAFLTLSSFYGAFYLGAKKTKEIFTTTIYGGVINILLAIILIPHIGLHGVAVGTAVGYFSLFVIRLYLTKSFLKFRIPVKTLLKYGIISVCAVFLALLGNTFYSSIGAVLFCAFFLWDNNRDLYKIGKILKQKF